MSAPGGPMVPDITGKSSVLPSGRVRLAFLSIVVPFLDGAQARHYPSKFRLVAVAAPADDVPQIIVGKIEELYQLLIVRCFFQIPGQYQIKLEQTSPALPHQSPLRESFHSIRPCA